MVKKVISSLMLVAVLFGALLVLAPAPTSAAPTGQGNTPCSPLLKSGSFLAFPTWYEYVPDGRTDAFGNCTIPDLQLTKGGGFNGTGILLVLLAFVDIVLRLAGIAALIYIVYGGIRYVMSQGSPDKSQQAQSTLQDAVTGLVIAVVAVAFVSFIGHHIGSGSGGTGPLPKVTATQATIQQILDIVFTITGALSLLVITIAGFRFVVSRGDPQKVSQARNAILYALIGLLVTISGLTIVTFVLNNT